MEISKAIAVLNEMADKDPVALDQILSHRIEVKNKFFPDHEKVQCRTEHIEDDEHPRYSLSVLGFLQAFIEGGLIAKTENLHFVEYKNHDLKS